MTTPKLIWTPRGSIRFPHLETPSASRGAKAPKYGCSLLVEKATGLGDELTAALLSAAERVHHNPGALVANALLLMTLDDEKAVRHSAEEGDIIIPARSPTKPLTEGNCVSGADGRLLVRPYAAGRAASAHVGLSLVKVLALGVDVSGMSLPPPPEKFSFLPTNKGDAL